MNDGPFTKSKDNDFLANAHVGAVQKSRLTPAVMDSSFFEIWTFMTVYETFDKG